MNKCLESDCLKYFQVKEMNALQSKSDSKTTRTASLMSRSMISLMPDSPSRLMGPLEPLATHRFSTSDVETGIIYTSILIVRSSQADLHLSPLFAFSPRGKGAQSLIL